MCAITSNLYNCDLKNIPKSSPGMTNEAFFRFVSQSPENHIAKVGETEPEVH